MAKSCCNVETLYYALVLSSLVECGDKEALDDGATTNMWVIMA